MGVLVVCFNCDAQAAIRGNELKPSSWYGAWIFCCLLEEKAKIRSLSMHTIKENQDLHLVSKEARAESCRAFCSLFKCCHSNISGHKLHVFHFLSWAFLPSLLSFSLFLCFSLWIYSTTRGISAELCTTIGKGLWELYYLSTYVRSLSFANMLKTN